MAMSLDGFIAYRDGDVSRIFPDLDVLRKTEALKEPIKTTGAVVMGRRAYDMRDPDSYVDHYEYQVPLFVLAHHVSKKPPEQNARLRITFVTDGIKSALEKGKAAAGDKDVTVIGCANTAQPFTEAGFPDEIRIDLVPVILAGGIGLFEHSGTGPIELERMDARESPLYPYLGFRVLQSRMKNIEKHPA